MATSPTTLTESIDAAIKVEDDKNESQQPADDKAAPKVDKSADDKTDDKAPEPAKPNQYGLSEVEQEQAKQLFAGLKDPKQSPIILEFFAKQAGVGTIETEADVKEAKSDIHEMLKGSLGPEFEYLADKLGPALSKYVDEKLAESTKDIRDSMLQQEQTKLENQATQVRSQLAKDFFDKDDIPDDVLAEMTKLMDRMPASADMTVREYVTTIFHSVVGAKGLTKADPKKNEKVNRNRNDAPSRLASQRHAEPVTVGVAKTMGLNEAIAAAIEAADKE